MKFGYAILFVPDVEAAVDFYERAFGAKRKMVNKAFAALDTGATTLAFGWEENEKKELTENAGDRAATVFRANRATAEAAGVQISFIADDVKSAFARALAAGATEVYAPVKTPWGQWVGRVRDLNGVLVSIVSQPPF